MGGGLPERELNRRPGREERWVGKEGPAAPAVRAGAHHLPGLCVSAPAGGPGPPTLRAREG